MRVCESLSSGNESLTVGAVFSLLVGLPASQPSAARPPRSHPAAQAELVEMEPV